MATKYINSITYGGNEYKIIDDTSGYTKNTGTVTSVGLTNATNGGLTVSGSPVTGSGSITVGHTNVLTNAQTTQAVYPIAIDKNGHISSYGTAVNIPTPELFVVNATITQMTDGVPTGGTTDKSAQEIHSAAASGLLPIVKVTMQGYGTVYLVAPLAITEDIGDSYYARFVYEDQANATFQYATLQVVGNDFAIAFLPPYLKSGGYGDGGASLQISADDVSLMFNDGDSNVWNVSNSATPATIGHITSVTSANTQAVYPITIDSNGHITSYGNAVTPLEPFKITLTVQPGPTYVPDKTYAEVTAAEAAGKFVYVYFHDTDAQTDMTYILPLVSINNDSGEIYFECFGNGCYYVCTINSQNGADFESMSMGSSGGGTVTSVSISGTSPITASGTVTSSGTLSVSHAASGVTAGTYIPSATGDGGYYLPSITVDSTGHVTSANNYAYTVSAPTIEIFEYDGTSPYNPTWGFDDIGNAVSNSRIPIVIWGYEVYYYGYAGSDPDDGDYYQFINQVQTPYSNNTGIIYYLTVWEGGSFDVGSTTALYSDTNTRVTQTVRTNDANYPLLLAPSGQTATTTTTANFATAATYNPSTGILSVKQKVLAGTTSDTTENWVQVASKSGAIYLDSVGNSSGNGTRGIWIGAHGTATSGKWALEVDTNNVVKLNGDITGNAATATSATSATSATTATSATSADHASKITMTSTNPTSGTTYYVPFTTGTTTGTNYAPNGNNGIRYNSLEGTTSAAGYGRLILGNSTATGTAANKTGWLRIYGDTAYYMDIKGGSVTANRTVYLPTLTATGYLLGKSVTTAVGASNQLVYFSAAGVATAGIKISGGTADPSGGSSGDIYIQYSA